MKYRNLCLKLCTLDEWMSGEPVGSGLKITQLNRMADKYLVHRFLFENDLSDSMWLERMEWVEVNFTGRYALWNHEICCRNEEDAMAFKLRWM